MVLPAGTSVPPLPHLAVLLAGVAAVGYGLWRERPAVTRPVALALAPWMVLGASLHVLYQVGLAPPALAPLLGTPAVYVATAVVAGATWLLVRRLGVRPPLRLAAVGTALALTAVGGTLAVAGVVRVVVPLAGLAVGLALGAGAWRLVARLRPAAAEASGAVGGLVVVAHALDAVSTAVGIDVLGFGERTPASRVILEVAAGLPTAEVIGVGWLFVLVKLAVAGAVVVYFAEYVREEPAQANALLAGIAAVGLGPGAHNLLLFAVAAG